MVNMRISSMITPLTLSGWEPNSRADHDQVTVPEQESSPRTQIQAAGFENIGTDHAARCLSCGLLVYEWPPNIEPFTLHAQRSPACSFVLSLRPTLINRPLTTATTADDQPSRQTKLDPLVEVHTLKVARQRTFSHWPHRSQHSAASMIEAGFFCCNVDDRVICLYCNLICQGWRDSKDDASAVHKALSPRCPYVTSTLIAPASSTASEQIANRDSAASVDEPSQGASFGDILTTQTRRAESFLRRLSSDLEWSPQVNEQIQGTAEEVPEGVPADSINEEERPCGHTDDVCNKAESLLSRLVAARLSWKFSQGLLNHFSRSVVKRCWEDQLRIKHDDFISDTDLWLACTILEKQIEHIQGNEENVVVARRAMEKVRQNRHIGDARMNFHSTPTSHYDPCQLCSAHERRLASIPCGRFGCSYSARTMTQHQVD